MWKVLFDQIKQLIFSSKPKVAATLSADSIEFLTKTVTFYRQLDELEQQTFNQRVLMFLTTTEILGRGVDVSQQDRLLVAASAIIPV